MFITTYATYTATNNTISKEQNKTEQRSQKFTFETPTNPLNSVVQFEAPTLPLSYISDFKALSNKFLIAKNLHDHANKNEPQLPKEPLKEFSTLQTTQIAKGAYETNQLMLPVFTQRAQRTLDQTPKSKPDEPKELALSKEKIVRTIMAQTYAANDSYYKITA